MIIISDKYGNLGLGNRLFLFAHFLANAIEYGYKLSYPGFHEYAHYFKSTESNFFCQYPASSSMVGSCRPVQQTICYLLKKFTSSYHTWYLRAGTVKALDITARDDFDGDYNLNDVEFVELREASRMLLVKGWAFRDERNLRKHAQHVRRFFRPVDRHAANVSRLIERARQDCDVLVGIHIRQGDYKNWLGGKYFYDTVDYVNIIKESRDLWGDRCVKYLICSNEKQNEQLFEGLNYIVGNDDQLEDMHAFASCDYLVGPPSTYTMWASFYGSVPLSVVEAPKATLTLEGFKIVEG